MAALGLAVLAGLLGNVGIQLLARAYALTSLAGAEIARKFVEQVTRK